MKYASTMYHQHVANIHDEEFESGHMRNMGNSNNVYKTLKYEAGKKKLVDPDVNKSLLKLKGHFESSTPNKGIKGFIQSLQLSALNVTLYSEEDIDFFQQLWQGKHHGMRQLSCLLYNFYITL